MMMMTKELLKALPKLRTYENAKAEDVPIAVKFFDPTGSWTWYATEGDVMPDGDIEFFGLVRGFETELGYFRLSDLQNAKAGMRGMRALPIERDRNFGKHTLKEAMDRAI